MLLIGEERERRKGGRKSRKQKGESIGRRDREKG